jgi:hypothetical protein
MGARLTPLSTGAPKCAVALAVALRESLLALSAARLAGEGQQTKMGNDLPVPDRSAVQAPHRGCGRAVYLDRERKAMTRLWAKREEQIHGVVETMAGLYGDLQGIAGRSLQEIERLEVPLLDGLAASEAAEMKTGRTQDDDTHPPGYPASRRQRRSHEYFNL